MKVLLTTRMNLRYRAESHLTDLLIFGTGIALFYGVLMMARRWLGPFTPAAQISLSPLALPTYAVYSLLRISIAYVLSFTFAIVYGYIAAYNAKAERVMIPLLDILQSIPVLSFLPGVMLATVALFPNREIGVELGSILLIFTGQAWNIAFSFYSSLKGIPREFQEAACIYRFNWWQRFTQLELPYAAIGLVWNSMMSVAGGWFFLMACEMFVLGERDFRLPGIGSYLQMAASEGNTSAILYGLAAMISVIVLLDQLVWRPVIAWADKFKFEQVESADSPRSLILNLLRRSVIFAYLNRRVIEPLDERISLFFTNASHLSGSEHKWPPQRGKWLARILGAILLAAICYGATRAALMMTELTQPELVEITRGAVATMIRVSTALAIAVAWAVPAGVKIGFSPRLARLAQPLAQIAASVPATALFPVLLLVLVKAGGGLGLASVVLMLLGTQWYILFNVIAGAMAIPTDLKEAASLFRFGRLDRWRWLILPGIFPYLVTGLVTAAGGAWNASIVAEYFRFKGQTLSTVGLGAIISQATDTGNFDQLLAATIVMAAMVVTINRLVWRKLYLLAETRFKLET
jgi:NitT/TauT family transport system permease protein